MNKHKTLFLDIETTGLVPSKRVPGKRPGTTKKENLDYKTDYMQFPYIVSMAWKVDDSETQHYIINQEGREIPKEASDIHGITTEIAEKSEITFCKAILLFIDDTRDCEIVVGHGLYFDTSIVKAGVLREIKKEKPDYAIKEYLFIEHFETLTELLHKDKRIDTMRSSAKMMRGWPTLSELHFKIFRKGFEAHDNKNDVEACCRCYEWLLKKNIVPTWEKLQEKKENG